MQPFYTWVGKHRDSILVREVRDGERHKFEVEYKPTMYVSAPAGEETEWHTLDGMPVKPIEFDSMGAVRRHIDDAAEIDNYTIYGNDGFQYAYIADNYHGQIEIDPKLIVIANVEIGDGVFQIMLLLQ